MNIRQIFGLLAAIACAGSVQAQRVGWEADFKTRFDNREFTGSSCNESQTIFLADLSTAVSYNWLDRNTLRFGVQMQKDFGDNRDYFSEVRPLASYAYRAERLGADVGIFSRDELRGDYSHAFFNDSLRVYDPTIQLPQPEGAARRTGAQLGRDVFGIFAREVPHLRSDP